MSNNPFSEVAEDSEEAEDSGSALDDLDKAVGDQDQPVSQTGSGGAAGESSSRDASADSAGAADSEPESEPEPEEVDPFKTPAFDFEATSQKPFYVREDVLEEWDETLQVEVQPELIADGVRELAKSEYHDAVLRLARDNPELVAQYIKEARGIDTDEGGESADE